MAEVLEMNPQADDLATLLKQTKKAMEENTKALNASRNHLMHQGEVIKTYFDGVSYNTAIRAMYSKDFPKVFLSKHKNAKPLYPSKGVEQWIHEHTVYGY